MIDKNTYTVYKHTSPSGKVYIGITNRDPIKRWGQNGMYYKGSHKFYNAILKYGWDNIIHEILYTNLSEKEAKSKEVELISHYKAFDISYNITDGGGGSLGLFPNEDTRKKIGEKSKGRECKESTRIKLSNALKGKKKPEGFGEALSKKLKGRKFTPEQIEKSRLARIGLRNSEEAIAKWRLKMVGRKYDKEFGNKIAKIKSIPIVQLTLKGDFVSFWESAKIAAETMGYTQSKITACCKNKRSQSNKYIWRYLSDYDISFNVEQWLDEYNLSEYKVK